MGSERFLVAIVPDVAVLGVQVIDHRLDFTWLEGALQAQFIGQLTQNGKIFLVKNSEALPQKDVLEKWRNTNFIKYKKGNAKGWILEIMNCADKINRKTFSLEDMYSFESHLKQKYPKNNHIKDKIRQQLQVLRDKGIIEFKGHGKYEKI